jgi:hypothetical protein
MRVYFDSSVVLGERHDVDLGVAASAEVIGT